MSINIGQWGAPDNLVVHPTLNPTPADFGFPLGTQWVNQSTDSIWFLVDNTPGAAVWVEAGGGSLNLFDVTDPDVAQPATMTIATPTVTAAAHGYINEQEVKFAGAGIPPELVAGVSYYVYNKTVNTFEVTAAPGVAPSIVFSANGIGTVESVNGAVSIPVVDQYDGVNITLTAAGVDQYLQNPTDIVVHHVFTVANNLASTDPIDIYSGLATVTTLLPGQAQKYIWDGAEWVLGSGIDAEDVDYVSPYGMTSANVQTAINEVFTKRNWFSGYNNTVGAIAAGVVVKLADGYDSAASHFPYITPVTALTDIPCGITAEAINAGAIGCVHFFGMLDVAVNTAAGALGDNVYFTVAGAPTLVAGSAAIGVVNFVNAAGRVFYDFTELTTSGEEGILTVADLATAEALSLAAAATPWIYVTALDTIYHYNATSAVTRDAKYILNTADAGNTRWEATCGQYVYHSHIGTFGFDTLEKETADRTIYLATTGSDTTGDGTVGNPFFSPHRAILDIKQSSVFTTYAGKSVTLRFAAGTYDYSALGNLDMSRFLDLATAPRIRFQSEDGTVTNCFTQIDSGTLDASGGVSSSGSVLKETGKAWALDTHKGRFFIINTMIAGAGHMPSNDTQRCSYIWGNSADTLYTSFICPNSNYTDVATYSISEHKVVLNFGTNALWVPTRVGVTFTMVNVVAAGIYQGTDSQKVGANSEINISASLVTLSSNAFISANNNIFHSAISITANATVGSLLYGCLTYGSTFITARSSASTPPFTFKQSFMQGTTIIQTGASKFYAGNCEGGDIEICGPIRLVGFKGLLTTNSLKAKTRVNITRADVYDHMQPIFYHNEYASPADITATAANALIYCSHRAQLDVPIGSSSAIMRWETEPSYGRITYTNAASGEIDTYFDIEKSLTAIAIAPDNKKFKTYNLVTNTDVDTGTEEIDYFLDTIAATGVRWDVTVSKSGAFKRMFSINATWDAIGNTIIDSGEYGIVNIGDTSAVTFSVTIENTGAGTVSNAAGGTTVTGVGTRFTNTFKAGDTVTIGADIVIVMSIASDTSMTTTTITNAHAGVAYTFADRVTLNAIAASDNWTVRAQRYLI